MKLTQLRSFHAVAQAGGFVAGAGLLNVSQPTLTAQVLALEKEFDVELFYRRNRRTELTPAGRDLHAITTRMFAEEQEARQFLAESKGLRTGQLRIGAVGPYHVTEMLSAFSTRYPGISLSVAIGNSADVQRDLQRSDVRRPAGRSRGRERQRQSQDHPPEPHPGRFALGAERPS